MKTILPWLLVVGLLVGAFFQYRQNQSLRRDQAELQSRAATAEKLEQEVAALRPLKNLTAEVEQFRKDAADVHKLRNETRQLQGEKKTLGQKVAGLEQQNELFKQRMASGGKESPDLMRVVQTLAEENKTLEAKLADALANPQAAQQHKCVDNLKQLDGATEQWGLENQKRIGDGVTFSDLVGPTAYIRQMPVCPLGGHYTVTRIGEPPRCSYPGHILPE